MSVSVDGWRLAQVFISPRVAVFEVELNQNDLALRCTCPGFVRRKNCKHVGFVSERLDRDRKTYPLDIWRSAVADDLRLAEESPEAYRNFILAFGKVEVL